MTWRTSSTPSWCASRAARPATPTGSSARAKKIGKLFSQSKVRHQIDDMIKIINEQADAVAERHHRYRAEDIVSKPAPPRTVDPRLEAMYREVTQLVGIEKPSDELTSMLSPLGNDDMKMVSVVGVGGLGKTTLAKGVYDKFKVNFDCTAFVPVGRDPDLKKVFRDILIDLDKEFIDLKFTILDERQLINEIRKYLKNKRYLIVIDDVWKTDTWKSIKHALVQNNNGSRLITTTRISDVADQAGEVYKLEPLQCDQSEKLFYTRIFGANGTCPSNQLKKVSDKILNKCHDVPLAIITMASLLVGKSAGEWIEVCNSIVFRDKKKNQQVSDTEWILSLSYYDLPPHLKTCLLYLSAFPEDFVIGKDTLIWRWMAEGFVYKEPGTESLFEVGEGYFSELINRRMIQAVELEVDGIIDACHIHDMVLDLLLVKSQEVNFATIVSGDNNENKSSTNSNIRRLAHQNRKIEQTHQDTQADMRQVRTFIVVRCRSCIFSVMSFQLLRVLAIEFCNARYHMVRLEHIESLLHLRYLEVSGTPICVLQEGIGALKFLQTLDLRWTSIKELSSSVGLLTQLICLRARDVMVPNRGLFEKLTSLDELQIDVSGDMTRQFVKDLGNLRELRVLKAFVEMTDEVIMQSDLVKSLGNLYKLQHLALLSRYASTDVDEALWDSVVLPQSLRCLIVPSVSFSALPSCINPSDLSNLTRLKLDIRHMDEQSWRILGRLRELHHLVLLTQSMATVTIHHASERENGLFKKLISLSVNATVHFTLNKDSSVTFTIATYMIWNADVDGVAFGSQKEHKCMVHAPAVMPNLQLLEFRVRVQALFHNKRSCDCLGLEYLPSLQKVKVALFCHQAFANNVDREEAALRHAIEDHPNRPTLQMHKYGDEVGRRRGGRWLIEG